MEIFFIRHGETLWNKEERLQGITNEPLLTDRGIKQAEEVRKKLEEQNIEYDVIIASPLDRTIKTAQIINKNKADKIEIIEENKLIERGYGDLEGAYAKSGKYDINELWDCNKNTDICGIEPVKDFISRVHNYLENLLKENKYNKVMIVSHSGVGIALRTYFEGFPPDGDLLKLRMENCEILRYRTIKN